MGNEKVEFKKSDVYTKEDFEQDVKSMFGELKVIVFCYEKRVEIVSANNTEDILMTIDNGIFDFRTIGDDLGLKIYQLWKKIGQAKNLEHPEEE